MNTTVVVAVLVLGLMVFFAHLLDEFFVRTRIPDVLLLLVLGILVGPVLGIAKPSDFGAVGPVFATVTLVIILFEGGLGLDLRVVVRSLAGATGLTLLNFAATFLAVMPIAHAFLGFTWLQAATLSALLGGTSSAVVIPLVQGLNVGKDTRAVLSLESALSDVLVIVVALGLIDAQARGELVPLILLRDMAMSFLFAAMLGLVAGIGWSLMLGRLHGLQNSILTTPAFVFVVFGSVELMGMSGAIAALVLGITLGNIRRVPLQLLRLSPGSLVPLNETERSVFREVVFLMKTFLFVYIGVSIQFSSEALILAGMALTLALFAVRVTSVHLSLAPRTTTNFEAAVCGAMAPKGLATAVVASIPLAQGLPMGEELKLVAFAVVLFTILATSFLVFLLERGWLQGLWHRIYWRYPGSDTTSAAPLAEEPSGGS